MIKATYIDHMGNDLTVVNSARISMNRDSKKLNDKDKKLINYLATHQHYTPFEHCSLSLLIECPLYIRSQIMRHRTFSYNEISRRYTDEDIEFYNPPIYRKQHKSSKQCSDGTVEDQDNFKAEVIFQSMNQKAHQAYTQLLDLGVARELARGVLPQNLITKFFMSGNLRNWTHFVKLREDSHAQEEVQILSKQIRKIIEEKFPYAFKALMEQK